MKVADQYLFSIGTLLDAAKKLKQTPTFIGIIKHFSMMKPRKRYGPM